MMSSTKTGLSRVVNTIGGNCEATRLKLGVRLGAVRAVSYVRVRIVVHEANARPPRSCNAHSLFCFNARRSTDHAVSTVDQRGLSSLPVGSPNGCAQKIYTKRACKHVYATHAVYILNVCIVLTLTLANGSFYLNRTRDTVGTGSL